MVMRCDAMRCDAMLLEQPLDLRGWTPPPYITSYSSHSVYIISYKIGGGLVRLDMCHCTFRSIMMTSFSVL